MYRLFELAE